jgi:hypothetical protein
MICFILLFVLLRFHSLWRRETKIIVRRRTYIRSAVITERATTIDYETTTHAEGDRMRPPTAKQDLVAPSRRGQRDRRFGGQPRQVSLVVSPSLVGLLRASHFDMACGVWLQVYLHVILSVVLVPVTVSVAFLLCR